MDVSLMRQFSAMAASTAYSTAFLLSTGSAPGRPRQTGQTLVLGGAPNCVEQPQKIFVCVSSCTCTSRPMTGSYFSCTRTASSLLLAISHDYSERVMWRVAWLVWRGCPPPAAEAAASARRKLCSSDTNKYQDTALLLACPERTEGESNGGRNTPHLVIPSASR